jgi:hypothetical protein
MVAASENLPAFPKDADFVALLEEAVWYRRKRPRPPAAAAKIDR